MRITHICTSNRGGAAQAALRLHKALLEAGQESRFLVAEQKQDFQAPNMAALPPLPKPGLLARLANRLGFAQTAEQRYYKLMQSEAYRAGDFEIFSSPESSYRYEEHPWVEDADIINLHWVANSLNYPSFFAALQHKNLVWTFHDMNPFFGGFHYRGDTQRNPQLAAVEQQVVEEKRQALQSYTASRIAVVCPSLWLAAEAEQSEFFAKSLISHIPYSLDTNCFCLGDKQAARRALGLDSDAYLIVFVSENLNNRRKGMALLLEALANWPLLREENIGLLAIGDAQKLPQSQIYPIHCLGRIEEEEKMALAYQAGDCFVIPSSEDNLPNVVLEALCTGLPVASFPVGGMLDMIAPGTNGEFALEQSPQALAQALEKIYKGKYKKEEIARAAQEKYKHERQAAAYRALYEKLLLG